MADSNSNNVREPESRGAAGAPCPLPGPAGAPRPSMGRGGLTVRAPQPPRASQPATFVLLHGFAQGPETWEQVSDALRERGHAVVCPRLDSSSFAAACSQVSDVVRTTAAAAHGPVVLVGYSMGGRIALEAVVREGARPCAAEGARACPFPLDYLILESAGLGPKDDAAREVFAARSQAWAQQLRSEGTQRFMDYWEQLPLFASQARLPRSVRERVRAARLAHDAESLAQSFLGCGQQNQVSEAAALGALARAQRQGVTVAYVHGALDTKYAEVAASFATVLGGRAFVRAVPDAGHNVHLERPDAFVAAIGQLVG